MQLLAISDPSIFWCELDKVILFITIQCKVKDHGRDREEDMQLFHHNPSVDRIRDLTATVL